MRRFRERAAERNGAVTPTVTIHPSKGRRETQKHKPRRRRARVRVVDAFDEFWHAFPTRDGDNPIEPARAAWRQAVASGEPPERIIAAANAYANATAGRERRYIASAARWLGECRWSGDTPAPRFDAPTASLGVGFPRPSPEWRAWVDHWRATKGEKSARRRQRRMALSVAISPRAARTGGVITMQKASRLAKQNQADHDHGDRFKTRRLRWVGYAVATRALRQFGRHS